MNQDDDIVQGTVLMRRGEQSSPDHRTGRGAGASINNRASSAGIEDRERKEDSPTARCCTTGALGIL